MSGGFDPSQSLRDLALLRRVRDRIDRALLPHNDPGASLAFYRDTLGFEVRNDVEYGGMHRITLGPPARTGTSIVLYPPGAGITDDVDGVFARLEAGDASSSRAELSSDRRHDLYRRP